MKKKLLALFICIFALCVALFTLTACGSSGKKDDEIYQVYSSYVDYTISNGEEPLSYEEWLVSIKGEKGDKGDQGIQGEKGEKGEQGIQGPQGEIGKDGLTPTIEIIEGYWYINGENTGVKAEAKDGQDGLDGKDGAAPTIKISEDGYWMINGEKTEHKAVCEDAIIPNVEFRDEIYWIKERQRFSDKPIMVAYSHGADLGYINTELAYVNACIAGFEWIKGDVQPTSDGKLIMCHDDGFTFDENGYITTYNAGNNTLIHDMTYAECMGKYYNRAFHVFTDYSSGTAEKEEYRPKVCDFEQFLIVCKEYEVRPYIVIRNDNMDVVVPELLRLLESYDFLDNCIVNSFNVDSVKQVAEQSKHRVMISVVKEYAQGTKLTTKEVDDILNISPNCTINIYASANISSWNNVKLIEQSQSAIEYAKQKGVVVGTAFVKEPNPLIALGIGLMQCETPCIQTKVTPITLCVALNKGKVTLRRYGAYGALYTADIIVKEKSILLRNIRRIESNREFADGITPNLAGLFPYDLNAVGENVTGANLYWHNVIEITFDSNIADINSTIEKRIFIKFTYGI